MACNIRFTPVPRQNCSMNPTHKLVESRPLAGAAVPQRPRMPIQKHRIRISISYGPEAALKERVVNEKSAGETGGYQQQIDNSV